ncbi:hypothetical protein BH24CHL10_BH24CHL10_02550 [soil metagenome]
MNTFTHERFLSTPHKALMQGLAGFLVSAVGIELLVNVVPWGGAAHFTQVLAEETGELICRDVHPGRSVSFRHSTVARGRG